MSPEFGVLSVRFSRRTKLMIPVGVGDSQTSTGEPLCAMIGSVNDLSHSNW